MNIAAKLTNTKDVRDFFIDLVEKVIFISSAVFLEMSSSLDADLRPCSCPQFIEPCRSEKWTSTDVNLYLTHYTNSAHILDSFK